MYLRGHHKIRLKAGLQKCLSLPSSLNSFIQIFLVITQLITASAKLYYDFSHSLGLPSFSLPPGPCWFSFTNFLSVGAFLRKKKACDKKPMCKQNGATCSPFQYMVNKCFKVQSPQFFAGTFLQTRFVSIQSGFGLVGQNVLHISLLVFGCKQKSP